MERPVNFRDLGGMAAAGGKTIKQGRLLRSGEVCNLSPEEKDTLLNQYHLKTIIDLRTHEEAAETPDDELSGVKYVNIDIMKSAEDEAASYGNFKKIKTCGQVHDFMKIVYETTTLNQDAQEGYSQMLKLIKDQTEGAVLFHCFAGKDRTGIAAAIILALLGVSKEDILQDYLKTNESRRAENERILALEKQKGKSKEELEILETIFTVNGASLLHVFDIAEQRYGSFVEYIKQTMDTTDADIEALRENYLD